MPIRITGPGRRWRRRDEDLQVLTGRVGYIHPALFGGDERRVGCEQLRSRGKGMAKLSEGMERLGGEEIGRERSIKKVALASSIGATIEWYDFFIYGTTAGLVFNQLFFPNFDPLVGTLAAYATFAAGFVARPVGGVIFGHFGDRIGRKTMLILTLLIMGVATFLI